VAPPCGGVAGVVEAGGAISWLIVVIGLGGQRVGRATVGSAIIGIGVVWRSAAATGVHGQRVASSGAAVDTVVVGVATAGAGSRHDTSVHAGA
jgi:hypothetical protein